MDFGVQILTNKLEIDSDSNIWDLQRQSGVYCLCGLNLELKEILKKIKKLFSSNVFEFLWTIFATTCDYYKEDLMKYWIVRPSHMKI